MQIQFSGKSKKNIISLSSAESAQRMVKVKENDLVKYKDMSIRKAIFFFDFFWRGYFIFQAVSTLDKSNIMINVCLVLKNIYCILWI